jgi:hypothetical protein
MSSRDLILILSIFLCPPAALALAAMFTLGELITWADKRNSRPVPAKPPLVMAPSKPLTTGQKCSLAFFGCQVVFLIGVTIFCALR